MITDAFEALESLFDDIHDRPLALFVNEKFWFLLVEICCNRMKSSIRFKSLKYWVQNSMTYFFELNGFKET